MRLLAQARAPMPRSGLLGRMSTSEGDRSARCIDSVGSKSPGTNRFLPKGRDRGCTSERLRPEEPPYPVNRRVGRRDREDFPSSFVETNEEYRITHVVARTRPDSNLSSAGLVHFPTSPHHNGLVKFRSSDRWLPNGFSPLVRENHSVPYVNKIGKISSITLGYWKTSSASFLATLLSTINYRIQQRVRKWARADKKFRSFDKKLIFQMSFLSLYQNDEWYLRTYGLIKNQPKALRNHLYFFLKQMDEPKRFLYDQMLQNISWLQFRTAKAVRAKSIDKIEGFDIRRAIAFYENQKLLKIYEVSIAMARMYVPPQWTSYR